MTAGLKPAKGPGPLDSGFTSVLATAAVADDGSGLRTAAAAAVADDSPEAEAAAGAGAGLGAAAAATAAEVDAVNLADPPPRRAGPLVRFTSVHDTALWRLSRSAFGVSGGASNIASVCLAPFRS